MATVLALALLAGCAGHDRSSTADQATLGSASTTAVGEPRVTAPTVTAPVSSTTAGGAAPGSTTAGGPGLAALAGHTIVIDPGHNGNNGAHAADINKQVFVGNGSKECDTTGTAGNDGYPEHAFTFDVATRLSSVLTAAGAHVVLTRPGDDGWGPCITERAAIGNAAAADLAVSIHADGGPTSGRGFHVIEPLPVPGYNDGIVDPSDRFGTILRDTFAAGTGMPTANYIATNGLVSRADLGGLNLSHVPKVFIECGNMRSATDESMLVDPAWRQRAAESIAQAMAAYFAST